MICGLAAVGFIDLLPEECNVADCPKVFPAPTAKARSPIVFVPAVHELMMSTGFLTNNSWLNLVSHSTCTCKMKMRKAMQLEACVDVEEYR